MVRRSYVCAGFLAMVVAVGARVVATDRNPSGQTPPQGQARAAREDGWTIPPDAKTETNPLQVNDALLASGKALFKSKCSRCHGPEGKGDGPDADPDYLDDMNLTNPERASRNPDGVVFYRAWNGRKKPKMPEFKSEMTRDEIWTVVSYVQTLRKKP